MQRQRRRCLWAQPPFSAACFHLAKLFSTAAALFNLESSFRLENAIVPCEALFDLPISLSHLSLSLSSFICFFCCLFEYVLVCLFVCLFIGLFVVCLHDTTLYDCGDNNIEINASPTTRTNMQIDVKVRDMRTWKSALNSSHAHVRG